MTRRRNLLAAGAAVVATIVVAVGVMLYRSSHRPSSDCDTVHAMLEYNKQFRATTTKSEGTDKAVAVGEQQYREWANGLGDYASQLSDSSLAGNAETAADLAGRLADLVPQYRAKPDDPALARSYADIGIEFGNAVVRLQYACPKGR